MIVKKQANFWFLAAIHLVVPALIASAISNMANGALFAIAYYARIENWIVLLVFQIIFAFFILLGTAAGVYVSAIFIKKRYIIPDIKTLVMFATIIYVIISACHFIFSGTGDYREYVIIITLILNPFIYYFLSKRCLSDIISE